MMDYLWSTSADLCASSEMMDHARLLEFYALFVGMEPGMVGLEECKSSFFRPFNRKMVTEKYLARHHLSIKNAAQSGILHKFHWPPGRENPADGFAKRQRDVVPLVPMGIFFGESEAIRRRGNR